MNRILRAVTPSLSYLAVLALAAGCKISACPDETNADGGTTSKDNCIRLEPTVQYNGTDRTGSQAWSSGKSVTIRNSNGQLSVSSTGVDPGKITVTGTPFTRDGSSDGEKQAATMHLAAMASPTISVDAVGNVTVDAPGGGVDGYKLLVELPATAFDGVLVATSGNGKLTFSGALTSFGNVLRSENGDVDAGFTALSSVAVTASTELGAVSFTGGWTSPMVSSDQKSGTATVGAGVGTLDVSSGNGDVILHAP